MLIIRSSSNACFYSLWCLLVIPFCPLARGAIASARARICRPYGKTELAQRQIDLQKIDSTLYGMTVPQRRSLRCALVHRPDGGGASAWGYPQPGLRDRNPPDCQRGSRYRGRYPSDDIGRLWRSYLKQPACLLSSPVRPGRHGPKRRYRHGEL